ncbi:hypothetical protein PENTCL1PPCAC_26138, partial [Pristionchus entomophagus]
ESSPSPVKGSPNLNSYFTFFFDDRFSKVYVPSDGPLLKTLVTLANLMICLVRNPTPFAERNSSKFSLRSTLNRPKNLSGIESVMTETARQRRMSPTARISHSTLVHSTNHSSISNPYTPPVKRFPHPIYHFQKCEINTFKLPIFIALNEDI